jgi:hypothetical protein
MQISICLVERIVTIGIDVSPEFVLVSAPEKLGNHKLPPEASPRAGSGSTGLLGLFWIRLQDPPLAGGQQPLLPQLTTL